MKRESVSRKSLVILAIILGGFAIFVIPRLIFKPDETKLDWSRKAEGAYYCPMHPSYVSDRPGDCPICNMKLVPRADAQGKKGGKERKILYYRHPMGQPDISPVPKKDAMGMDYVPVYEDEVLGAPSDVPGHSTVHIPLAKQQLIGVKLGTVESRKLTKEIRTVGRVAYDPELYSAQQEFLSALAMERKAREGPYHEPPERAEALVESARVRLRLLGLSEQEIVDLKEGALQDQNLILPASRDEGQWVWVYGMIYEYELPFVKIGTSVRVFVPTFPEKEFSGEVRSLDPVLDSETRSIRIRLRVTNPEGLLKPEMYVDLYLSADLGEALAVPHEAVMFTGERSLVFVALGEGYFQPRAVVIGTRAGDFYEVMSGLQSGDRIAVSGNFLIDSESRLQAALEGLTSRETQPKGGEAAAHRH